MDKIRKSTIIGAALWLVWFLFTTFYIYPKYLAKGIYDMTGTLMDWISLHYEGLLLIIWAIVTVTLLIKVLIKLTKEEDAKREIEKLDYKEVKEESEIK